MKKYFLLTCILFLVCQMLAQAQPVVKESLSLESKILQRKMAYSIYLPAGYTDSDKSYPILYLLHGRTGSEKSWIEDGNLEKALEKADKEGPITQMIIVMPQAFNSYYVDSYDGALPYERYFFEEFLPYIEETYRIQKKPSKRAIAGLSMGGLGALNYSIKHPELFGNCGALSAAAYSDEAMSSMGKDRYENMYGELYGRNLDGEARMTETWKANSPYHLLKKASTVQLKKVRWYIDCGDDDYLNMGNSLLHIQMLKQGIPHEFRVLDGAHNWEYWQKSVIPCLQYICQNFNK